MSTFSPDRLLPRGEIPRHLAFSLLLTLIACFSVALQPGIQYAPAWPATPVGVALLWMFGRRYWPAIFVANVALIVARDNPLSLAVIVGVMEVVIALSLLALLRRLHVRPDFARLSDIGRFGLAAVTVSAIAVPVHLLVSPFYPNFDVMVVLYGSLNYWLSETLSLLVFTPLVTAWKPSLVEHRSRRRSLYLSLLGLAVVGAGILLLQSAAQYSLVFLLLPFVMAAAVTGGIAGAALASTLVSAVVIAIAQQHEPSITDAILRILFTATTAITGYLLAALFTERDRISRQLHYRARHDSLTGLLNRYEFERALQRMHRHGEGEQHALLYLDLDQFKLVNDTCGHIAGDRMLMQLASRLRDALPETVSLARLGGDEFACLIEGTDEKAAMAVAESLERVVGDFRFVMGELQFNLGVSIGVTLFPAGKDDTPENALGRADVACYTAKEAGRSRSHLYRPQDEGMLNLHAGIQEVSQLQAALEQGRFMLFQQPIVRFDDGTTETVGYEVLLRMRGDKGPVSPADFLPVAQRYGLIEHIDRWVLERAAQFLGEHPGHDLRLNVNVSGLSVTSSGFFDRVLELPARYGFQPAQLALEITESIAIDRLEQVTPSLLRLREAGFGIVLDDFGAGVASFGYLRDLPVTEVKLDGRFVRDLGEDDAAALVIESLSRLSELRGLRCVAEWVESDNDIARLRELGIRYGQGFGIARPAPIEELAAELNEASAVQKSLARR
ncbi:MAG: EAL domain-containing protein [Gammaproteobacteria bacterium]|nr:EAL domain-containing protein [Gammaproteobacteria bacterium]